MSDPAYQSEAASSAVALVTIHWGSEAWPAYDDGDEPEGGIVRYAVAPEAVVIGGETFAPVESIKIELAPMHGGAEDEGGRIDLPTDLEPAKSILRYQSLRKDVLIEECDPADAEATRKTLGDFRITTTKRNPGGKKGLTRCDLSSAKADLAVSLGMSCQPGCQNTFGDATCEVNLNIYTFTVTMAVSGRRVTAALFNTLPVVSGRALKPGWARFGKLRRGGLVYDIADHDGDTITLFDEAPAHWQGQQAQVTAGCDKQPGTCGVVFNNTERFTGLMIGGTDYNPMFNNRPGG